ncbi:MAG: RadC family protein [Nanoarchaeota archaeon]
MLMLKEIAEEERPREKLQRYGPGHLSTAELLAIIIGTGSRGCDAISLSHKILKTFPADRLSLATVGQLQRFNGISTAKATKIIACFELYKRGLKKKRTLPAIRHAEDVAELLDDLKAEKQEHLVALTLTVRNTLIRKHIIHIGTADSNLIHPRDIFRKAIEDNATSLIVAHNHPSGNPEPSDEDLAVTKELITAGKLVGIPLIDHVIIGETFCSLREQASSEKLFK